MDSAACRRLACMEFAEAGRTHCKAVEACGLSGRMTKQPCEESASQEPKGKRLSMKSRSRLSLALTKTRLPYAASRRKSVMKRWDPMVHFKHQVALLRQLVPPPLKFEIFMGCLGSGIVGVRPVNRKNSRTKVAMQAKSANAKQTRGAERQDTAPAVKVDPSAGQVVLFLNSAAAPLQSWKGGKMLSGFSSALDLETRVLIWESQRSDVNGKVISKIMDHVHCGGEVVVAVRAAPEMPYGILGTTRHFKVDEAAKFLLQPGDHPIIEQGSQKVHKSITAQCLDDGLKAGVGLVAKRYPLPKTFTTPLYCKACCWTPATALVCFDDLDEALARSFVTGLPCKKCLPSDEDTEPQKRMNGKQPPRRGAGRGPHVLPKRREQFGECSQRSSKEKRPRWRKLSADLEMLTSASVMDTASTSEAEEETDLHKALAMSKQEATDHAMRVQIMAAGGGDSGGGGSSSSSTSGLSEHACGHNEETAEL